MRITIAAGVIDMIVDVFVYYALHWMANHWKPSWKKNTPDENAPDENAPDENAPKPGFRADTVAFMRDASLIQFERVLLSPLYYTVAMGLMYGLQTGTTHMDHSWAFVIGFTSGIVVTRIVHTIWGLRTGLFRDTTPK